MIACPQCKRTLNTSTERNGLRAHCSVCAITILSVGRLMQISDRSLVSTLWQSVVEMPDPDALPIKCPRCEKGLKRMAVRANELQFPIIACTQCYTLVLQDRTVNELSEQTPEHRSLQLNRSHQIQLARMTQEFAGAEKAISGLFKDLYVALVQFYRRAPRAVRFIAGGLALLGMIRFFGAIGTMGMIAGFLIALRVLPDVRADSPTEGVDRRSVQPSRPATANTRNLERRQSASPRRAA